MVQPFICKPPIALCPSPPPITDLSPRIRSFLCIHTSNLTLRLFLLPSPASIAILIVDTRNLRTQGQSTKLVQTPPPPSAQTTNDINHDRAVCPRLQETETLSMVRSFQMVSTPAPPSPTSPSPMFDSEHSQDEGLTKTTRAELTPSSSTREMSQSTDRPQLRANTNTSHQVAQVASSNQTVNAFFGGRSHSWMSNTTHATPNPAPTSRIISRKRKIPLDEPNVDGDPPSHRTAPNQNLDKVTVLDTSRYANLQRTLSVSQLFIFFPDPAIAGRRRGCCGKSPCI